MRSYNYLLSYNNEEVRTYFMMLAIRNIFIVRFHQFDLITI